MHRRGIVACHYGPISPQDFLFRIWEAAGKKLIQVDGGFSYEVIGVLEPQQRASSSRISPRDKAGVMVLP